MRGKSPTRAGFLPFSGLPRRSRWRTESQERSGRDRGGWGRDLHSGHVVAFGKRRSAGGEGTSRWGDFPRETGRGRSARPGCSSAASSSSRVQSPSFEASAQTRFKDRSCRRDWSTHLAPLPPELPAPTTGSLLPFRFLTNLLLHSALPSPLSICETLSSQSFPPHTPLARHSHQRSTHPAPTPKKPHPGERKALAARLTWEPRRVSAGCGLNRSLAQGEQRCQPRPLSVPFPKSAAAASGPRGICSRRSPSAGGGRGDEPPSALVAGMRNRGEVAGGGVGAEKEGRPPRGGKERAGGGEGAEAARHG